MTHRIIFRLFLVLLIVFEAIVSFDMLNIEGTDFKAAWSALPQDSVYLAFLQKYPMLSASLLEVQLLASVIGAAGAFFFKRWGRWLYVFCFVFLFILTMLSGPMISSGMEMALWELSFTANGALIMAMFLPPVATEFNKSR